VARSLPPDQSGPLDAYLLCSTPRTGSSLLCGLLESTGVAGRPASYFRAPDEPAWAAQWGIVRPGGAFDYADYLRSVLVAGRSDNGVFGARIMWGTMSEVVTKLRTVFAEPSTSDLDLLQHAFGETRLIYLRRDDVVAQAVSWFRAEQTSIWFETTTSHGQQLVEQPRFDYRQIEELHQLIIEHNAAWQQWFDTVGVEPHQIRCEDLDRDPVGATQRVLDNLDIELPRGRKVEVRHRRLADHLNTQWIERYRATTR
jgi:LPS sulfotransferase NodH